MGIIKELDKKFPMYSYTIYYYYKFYLVMIQIF